MTNNFKLEPKMQDEIYISCHTLDAKNLTQAIENISFLHDKKLNALSLNSSHIIFERFFCSDVYSQSPIIEKLWPASSMVLRQYIGQVPLDSNYISYQAYLVPKAVKERNSDGCLLIKHGMYTSLWQSYLPLMCGNSKIQSDEIIVKCISDLAKNNMSLADNMLRTWYYIRDIDNNYTGMIKSRTHYYETHGLKPQSHFIASTGIEACATMPHILSWLVIYAELGIYPQQIKYLKALDYLSPTHIYGVNFERATTVQYGDRRHCHISGTASIDKYGEVVHVGDVAKQSKRTIENIAALLQEGQMQIEDLRSCIVYLRDAHDYLLISEIIKTYIPQHCAINIVQGSVCRPDWLIEIEGQAISCVIDENWPNFI